MKIKVIVQHINSARVALQATNQTYVYSSILNIYFLGSILLKKFWQGLSSRELVLMRVSYADRNQVLVKKRVSEKKEILNLAPVAVCFLNFGC